MLSLENHINKVLGVSERIHNYVRRNSMFKRVAKQFLAFMVIISLLGSFFSVATYANEADHPYLIAEPGAKPSEAGELQVLEKNGGKTLCDQNGQPVQLRGMCTHGLQWYPEIINNNAFAALSKDWESNVIRLCMFITQDGYGTNPDIKQKVIDGINLAIANDMYVIVDWHVLNPGDPNAEVYAGAMDFFKEISGMYPNDKHIIYELANEPNGNSPGVTNDAEGWKAVKSYAEPIIKMLRDRGNENIIIVGTPCWSQRADLAADNPIDDQNTMYGVHFYAGSHLPGDYVMNNTEYAIKHGAPVFVSEWGPSESTGDGGPYFDYSDKWINYLNKNNISWCEFSLTNKNEKAAVFLPYEYAKTDMTLLDPGTDQVWDIKELTVTGEYIRARIKGIPYAPIERTQREEYSKVIWDFNDGTEQGFGINSDSPVKNVTVKNVNNALQITGLSANSDMSLNGLWSNLRLSSDRISVAADILGAEELTMDVIVKEPTTVSIAAIPQNGTYGWGSPKQVDKVFPGDFKLQKDGTYKAVLTIIPSVSPNLEAIAQDFEHSIMTSIILFVGSSSNEISLDNISVSGNSAIERPIQHASLGTPKVPSDFEDLTRNGWKWVGTSAVKSKLSVEEAGGSKALSWKMGYPEYKTTDGWATAADIILPEVNTTRGDNDRFTFDLYLAPEQATKGGIDISLIFIPPALGYWAQLSESYHIDLESLSKLTKTTDGLYHYKVSFDLDNVADGKVIKSDTVLRDIRMVLANNNSDYSGRMYIDNLKFEKSYSVSYNIQGSWNTGATVNVTIKNNSQKPINGWKLDWAFPGNQKITNIWCANGSQGENSVSAKDLGYNATIPVNGTVSFGFNISFTGSNEKPLSFTLNGKPCAIE